MSVHSVVLSQGAGTTRKKRIKLSNVTINWKLNDKQPMMACSADKYLTCCNTPQFKTTSSLTADL